MNILKISGKKWIVVSVLIMLLAFVGIGTAISYIMTETDPVENLLVPGSVSCEIVETFDGKVKTDVSVKNTGNTQAFIRAAVLVHWQSKTDTTEILARGPVEGVDYEIVYGDSGWTRELDGFWYYTKAVDPEESTSVLVKSVSQISESPEGYSLSVEIIASAIQSNPVSVVENEWGIKIDN